MSIEIVLKDRIKEISHSTGTGNFQLDGAATGYSAFSGIVPFNSTVFYCIRDNSNYEVGSGQLLTSGSDAVISRYPYQSTNSNNRVNFGAGVKEVFVTYPGKYSVISALPNDTQPAKSGIPFWNNAHTLNYDSNFIWDSTRGRMGVRRVDPLYTIDLGGTETESHIRASGFIAGDSGIMFSGVSATGGRQTEPFLRNIADTVTGLDGIISLSGEVDERLQLEKQVPTAVFAGPLSSCGCVSDYPTFRLLTSGDIPDLSFHYGKQYNNANIGSVSVYKSSGIYQFDNYLRWDVTNNRLGVNKQIPVYTLDVDGTVGISGNMVGSGNWSTSGTLGVDGIATFGSNVIIGGNLDVQGNVTYIDSATVTVLDKQIELGSLSGTAVYDESQLNDAGLTVLSTTAASGDKQWVWKGSNNRWNTSAGIGISVSGQIHGGSGLSVQTINVGNAAGGLNYINGPIFFRGSTSNPITTRITQNGINAYTSGAAYCGFLGTPWNQTSTWISNIERGEKTGQLFLYSAGVNSGVAPTTYDNYQRLAVSGNRFGNFEITTQALGSGDLRAIEFNCDVVFNSGVNVTSVSGDIRLSNTGMVTNSGVDSSTERTIVDASGLLVTPKYASIAEATGDIPVAQEGAFAFSTSGLYNVLLISNGTNWYSGILGQLVP